MYFLFSDNWPEIVIVGIMDQQKNKLSVGYLQIKGLLWTGLFDASRNQLVYVIVRVLTLERKVFEDVKKKFTGNKNIHSA